MSILCRVGIHAWGPPLFGTYTCNRCSRQKTDPEYVFITAGEARVFYNRSPRVPAPALPDTLIFGNAMTPSARPRVPKPPENVTSEELERRATGR